MLIKIVDNQWMYFEQISIAEENIIDNAFQVENPKAKFIEAGSYGGTIHYYNRFKRKMPLPFYQDVIALLDKRMLPYQLADVREDSKLPAESLVTESLIPGVVLMQYQVDAIKSTCRHDNGLISATTGSGKTLIMAGIIKVHDCNTAILCDMGSVLDQIKKEMELKDIAECGAFYAGKRPNGQKVIIGSIQALCVPSEPVKKVTDSPEKFAKQMKAWNTRRKNATTLRKLVGSCDMLLIDEADVAGSRSWSKLFRDWFKGRKKYGLSGSFFDPDKPIDNMSLRANIGNIIYQVDRQDVQDAGRIVPIKYVMLSFGNDDRNNKCVYDEALKEIMVENVKFHNTIAKLTEKSLVRGPDDGVFIIVESVQLGQTLANTIPNSIFISGSDSIKMRDKELRRFESRELKVLITSRIAKRGIDLKGGIETLIIASGGKLGSAIKQSIGRGFRVNKQGYTTVYDFMFMGSHYLYNHSKKRLKTVVGAGHEDIKLVTKKGIIDKEKLVSSKFRVPSGA